MDISTFIPSNYSCQLTSELDPRFNFTYEQPCGYDSFGSGYLIALGSDRIVEAICQCVRQLGVPMPNDLRGRYYKQNCRHSINVYKWLHKNYFALEDSELIAIIGVTSDQLFGEIPQE